MQGPPVVRRALLVHTRAVHVLRRILFVLVLAVLAASCRLLVPGSSGDATPSLPLRSSEAPRLSPSIEIPPPRD
jgi:hypothetical protein